MVRAFIVSGEYRGRFHGDPRRGWQFFGLAAMSGATVIWYEDFARTGWFIPDPGLNPRRGRAPAS